MSPVHDDLVALALGALEEEERGEVEAAVGRDPALANELVLIRRHLALHDAAPSLAPVPGLWHGLERRLAEEAATRPRRRRRLWVPLAAAATIAVALLLAGRDGPGVAPETVFGQTVHGAASTWSSRGISRMRFGPGVTVTLDDGTILASLAPNRLALRAGRAFFQVDGNRRGLRVEAGDLAVTTTGTGFLVEHLAAGLVRVWVESGTVRCARDRDEREVTAGGQYIPAAPTLRVHDGDGPRAWFMRPTLQAHLLAPATLRIVLRNEMPDPVDLAPPLGGEPLFFVSHGGHDYPLSPPGLDAPMRLAPGEARSFDLRLPVAADGEGPVVVSYPAYDLRTEVLR